MAASRLIHPFGPIASAGRKAPALLLLLLAITCLAPALQAGDPSFGSFVNNLERDFNLKRTHIPMFWLAKGVVRIASPATGVSRLDMAIFEDQDLSALLSAPDLKKRVDKMVGAGWSPFIETYERSGERTLMYMRERGKNVEMVILSLEPHEAVALLTRLNPQSLARAIEDPRAFALGLK
jgi:hypothetical protein